MHMFQLNGYKNGEHFNWIKKNLRSQWLLVWVLCLGLLRVFAHGLWLDIIIFISMCLVILEYRALIRLNTKKKLVYTPRVKRMTVTNILLGCLCLILGIIFLGLSDITSVLTIYLGLQIIISLLINTINMPIEKSINQHYINDAKRILKKSPNLTIIGVTGSYGKTSVKFYLKTLLAARYNVLVTPESYNTPMGVVRTIRESLKNTHEIFVCEMGARHVGDIKEICDIVHPDHGVITSIGPQHLETFFNMDNIKSTKFELADALPESGMLFLNGDNEYILDKSKEYKNKIFYSTGNGNEGYVASDISVSSLGTDFTVTAPNGEKENFQMHLIGQHNVINVVGAIAVAHGMGISLKELKIPVRRLAPVEHRMQIRDQGAVTIIDDAYNSNPVGSKAAVETLALFDGVKILVTPGMVELGDKEEEYNYNFGKYAADCCDYILLVGKKRTLPIKNGAIDNGFDESKLRSFDNLQEALSFAHAIKDQGHKYILLENDLPDNY
ncbi:MAG: UDP-N-acetylmuramoyl-tripeptide--D-alanyl-D-alanine ligase [Pseudobutyrivibrio sp.]|nr:UDP-N-acetylmuramoyl-tripeptide--D-alanyl-D-alanine ligase [Pseudobutyrivibrio sp.]